MDNEINAMFIPRSTAPHYGSAQATVLAVPVAAVDSITNLTISAGLTAGFVTISWHTTGSSVQTYAIRVVPTGAGAFVGPEIFVTEGGLNHSVQYDMTGAPSNTYTGQVYFGSTVPASGKPSTPNTYGSAVGYAY